MNRTNLQNRIRALGPWFHNLDLLGIRTAPEHFLGDYPQVKWQRFAEALPRDLSGCSVLDIGCNAGFYCVEMKRRGAARVVGIDADARYLNQARLVAEVLEQEIEFREMTVYDVAKLEERFDLVLFMGVFYHLRHPLLALDLLHEHVVDRLMVFQSMQRGSREVSPTAPDYDFHDEEPFRHPDFPRLHFIEKSYAGDPTNRWIPNRAAVEAMIRNAGFRITHHPEAEVYFCAPDRGTASSSPSVEVVG